MSSAIDAASRGSPGDPHDAESDAAAVFPGDSETAAWCRTLDWSATPLGPIAGWPQSLRTAISVMLASRFPMMIHWGPALTHFYNDGYAAILQGKHPGALGAPAITWWPEIWDQIGPIFDAVWRGETTYFVDTLVLPNRRGHVEECYFTFSHSPIRDEAGTVGGIFVTAVETTEHVVSRRRLATLRALGARLSAADVHDAGTVHDAAAAVLGANLHDVPFALLYRWEPDDAAAHLAFAMGLSPDSPLAPTPHPAGERVASIDCASGPPGGAGWPLASLRYRAGAGAPGEAGTVVAPAASFAVSPDAVPGGPWPEPAREALVLPLQPVGGRPLGGLVLGVSPRRPLDAEQWAFGQAVAEQIATALERVRLLADAETAHAAAEAERRRLAAVVAHLPVGVTFAEAPDGRHSLSNPAVAEIWGVVPAFPEVAAYSREFVGFRPGPGASGSAEEKARRIASHEWPLARALATGEVVQHELVEIERPDGTRRVVSLSAAPVRASDGRVEGALVTTLDVTEREQLLADAQAARAEAEAANRAKAEFLAVMSHELRTPLNAIGGYAELIELGIHGPVTEAQRGALARIQASQRHLLGLIAGVLDYSRIEAGAVTYRLADVPVGEAVAEAETLVAPQLRAKGLGYAWSGAPPGLCVRADREKLQQILLNLLGNAVKFTDTRAGAPGRIEVACTVEGGADGDPVGRRVRLHVRDTGAGIAADEIQRVFEPFVQADQRLTRPHAGVGLGLAISRDLARAMGGDLTAESDVGVGSTFTLTLPAAP